MERVGLLFLVGPVHQAAILVGSQGAMHEPFGIPGGFESAHRGLADQPQKKRHPKGSKRILFFVLEVWVAGIEQRSLVLALKQGVLFKEKDSGVIERHEQAGVRVGMNVVCEVATITDGARLGVQPVGPRWALSSLGWQPSF